MNLFFQIQSLQSLIFCMDDKEFELFLLSFPYNVIKVDHFLYRFIILLHHISLLSLTKFLLVPYAYVSIESIDCILLSLFELKAILLISSVRTLCLSLLKLCCIFNIDLLFFINYLILPISILFFSRYFILFSSWVAYNLHSINYIYNIHSFYNFQI